MLEAGPLLKKQLAIKVLPPAPTSGLTPVSSRATQMLSVSLSSPVSSSLLSSCAVFRALVASMGASWPSPCGGGCGTKAAAAAGGQRRQSVRRRQSCGSLADLPLLPMQRWARRGAEKNSSALTVQDCSLQGVADGDFSGEATLAMPGELQMCTETPSASLGIAAASGQQVAVAVIEVVCPCCAAADCPQASPPCLSNE